MENFPVLSRQTMVISAIRSTFAPYMPPRWNAGWVPIACKYWAQDLKFCRFSKNSNSLKGAYPGFSGCGRRRAFNHRPELARDIPHRLACPCSRVRMHLAIHMPSWSIAGSFVLGFFEGYKNPSANFQCIVDILQTSSVLQLIVMTEVIGLRSSCQNQIVIRNVSDA